MRCDHLSRKLRIAYLAHSVRSDWNNGNAHFLRGLLRALGGLGHTVTIFEPETDWSIEHLRSEPLGAQSLTDFSSTYPDLHVHTYSASDTDSTWLHRLHGNDIVVLHEWNPPQLAARLLDLRRQIGFRLLFHDTHHRASSSPEQIELFQLKKFDGILAFGKVLEDIYRQRFSIQNVWTLHEAADTTVFHPLQAPDKQQDIVWIGNWGDGERSSEICEFLLDPVSRLSAARATIYGVRYPDDGLAALRQTGIHYGGYLPNLHAPAVYASSRLTVHIPRRQYASDMPGIPTIRVFEALACGIPLLSAPWQDTEDLFRPGDLHFVTSGPEMEHAMRELLADPALAAQQARRGLETVLNRHTCDHRALQLTSICEDLLS